MKTNVAFWSVLLSFWAALLLSATYAAAVYGFFWFKIDRGAAQTALDFFVLDYAGLITGTGCATLWFMSFLVLRFVPDLIEDAIPQEEIDKTDYEFWKRRFGNPPIFRGARQ